MSIAAFPRGPVEIDTLEAVQVCVLAGLLHHPRLVHDLADGVDELEMQSDADRLWRAVQASVCRPGRVGHALDRVLPRAPVPEELRSKLEALGCGNLVDGVLARSVNFPWLRCGREDLVAGSLALLIESAAAVPFPEVFNVVARGCQKITDTEPLPAASGTTSWWRRSTLAAWFGKATRS